MSLGKGIKMQDTHPLDISQNWLQLMDILMGVLNYSPTALLSIEANTPKNDYSNCH